MARALLLSQDISVLERWMVLLTKVVDDDEVAMGVSADTGCHVVFVKTQAQRSFDRISIFLGTVTLN